MEACMEPARVILLVNADPSDREILEDQFLAVVRQLKVLRHYGVDKAEVVFYGEFVETPSRHITIDSDTMLPELPDAGKGSNLLAALKFSAAMTADSDSPLVVVFDRLMFLSETQVGLETFFRQPSSAKYLLMVDCIASAKLGADFAQALAGQLGPERLGVCLSRHGRDVLLNDNLTTTLSTLLAVA